MRVVLVAGPSQSGKSTLVGELAALGTETVEADLGQGLRFVSCRLHGEPWGFIDCPGMIESIGAVRTSVLAADAMIVCVGSAPEDAVLAAPWLRVSEISGTPSFLVVNRMDEATGPVRELVSALQDYSTAAIVLRQIPIRDDGRVIGAVDLVSERAWKYREHAPASLIEIPPATFDREQQAREEMLEGFSAHDDWLLEELVEDREPATGALYNLCTRMLQQRELVPAFLGSASHGNGITRLTKALRHEVPGVERLRARLAADLGIDDAESLRAVVFGGQHRRHLGKIALLRGLGGSVRRGARLGGGNLSGLAEFAGTAPERLEPGCIAAATKSDHLVLGQALTDEAGHGPPDWAARRVPMVAQVVKPVHERNETKLATALAALSAIDPGMTVETATQSGRPLVRIQGPVHQRSVMERLQSLFTVEAEAEPVPIGYRETITGTVETHYRHRKQTGGAGQFADVTLTVAPRLRGEGFAFDETVKGGAVPRNFIPAVEAGAGDATQTGPLGMPVVDISVTLTDGRHHSVDSSEHAFRTAARLAVRQALSEAGPVLLQPIHRVTFHVPSVFSGALVPLVSSLRGQVLGFERDPARRGWDSFGALLPASSFDSLARELRTATQGVGHFDEVFDHYEEVYGREAEHILAARQAVE